MYSGILVRWPTIKINNTFFDNIIGLSLFLSKDPYKLNKK